MPLELSALWNRRTSLWTLKSLCFSLAIHSFLLEAPHVELNKENSEGHVREQGHQQFGSRYRRARLWLEDIENVEATENKIESNEHLNNLRNGDPLGVEPLGLSLDSHEKVVKVHDPVDAIVHGRIPSGIHTSVQGVSVPGEDKRCNVMKPVQKDDGPLVDNEEEGINKLPVKMHESESGKNEIKAGNRQTWRGKQNLQWFEDQP